MFIKLSYVSIFLFANLILHFNQPPEANCYGTLNYIYKINGGDTESTSDRSVKFYLDGSQSYKFSVLAVNEEGLRSAFVTKTGTSPPLGK